MLVYIIRHGETNENRLNIIQGHMDTQLNQTGREQAEATGIALKDVRFVMAYSSDLSRAADTARIILAHHQSCELRLDRRLREIDMGSFTGVQGPTGLPDPPDAETYYEMGNRLSDFWDKCVVPFSISPDIGNTTETTDYVQPATGLDPSIEPAILVVSHGAAITKLIRDVLLIEHGYSTNYNTSDYRIHNNGISIVHLTTGPAVQQESRATNRSNDALEPHSLTVSGKLIVLSSISHLVGQTDIAKDTVLVIGS